MRWLAALTLTMAMAVPAGAMGVHESGDWTAVCDNLKTCTAILVQSGPLEKNQPFAAYLRLTREGSAEATPYLRIIITRGAGSVTPLVDGRPLRAVPSFGPQFVLDWPEDGDPGPSYFESELDPAQSAALLRALRRGQRLTLAQAGGASVTFKLAGIADTLRWIDSEQLRAGTRTAMLDRGDGVEGPPPPPPLPRIAAPPKVPQERLAAAPPPLVEIMRTMECGQGHVSEFITQRLAVNTMLWAPSCTPDEIAHRAYVSDGTNLRAIELPPPPDVDPATFRADLAGKNSDPRMVGYFPFRTLCGRQIEWIWTGNAFVLAGMWWVMDCRGVLEVDRIAIYRSEIVAGP